MTMAAAGASSYRDRTSEFVSITKTLRKFVGNSGTPPQTQLDQDPSAATPDRSEFNKNASKIGLRIHQTSQKIDRLSNLTRRSSIFDDRSRENEELTALIKNDITTLNLALSDLQSLQNMEITAGNYSGDKIVHLTAVCDDLKSRLMHATKQFQDVLTNRTKSIKAHENRKQIFSTVASRETLKHPPNSLTEPPPWLSSTGTSEMNPQSSASITSGVQLGSQLRRRMATDTNPSHQMEVSMLQQVVPRQDSESHSRTNALQNVESTISELSGIFTHLATMVAHQGELAIRIDDNMDESLANVEGASNALLKYLNKISSNRWLLIKLFLVIILFMTIFIVFVL
ncbi:syntaxin-31-like [Primulina eburnea]|uniref:syntaxin-31-like n=1 Tax=Primulina eburnea TaxID=1245227 RepID=UPI003C6C4239